MMIQILRDSAIWAAILGLATYFIRKLWENSAVNKAILAEIGRLLTVIEEHKKFWQERVADNTTSHHPLIPFSHIVYDKQVENVGVIKRGLVGEVVRFYGYVDFINSFQTLRKKYEAKDHTGEFNRRYIDSLQRLVDDFKATFGEACK
jgi:hypothetical protein